MLIVVSAGSETVGGKVATRVLCGVYAGGILPKDARTHARTSFKEEFPGAKLAILRVIVIPSELIEQEFMDTLARSLSESALAAMTAAEEKLQ